jgi:hypothetical protein
MYLYNSSRNLRSNRDFARFIKLGLFKLVILHVEESDGGNEKLYELSRTLFYIVDGQTEVDDAIEQTIMKGRDITLLKDVIADVESFADIDA